MADSPNTAQSPEDLEVMAKEARRRADIAKHKPLSMETLDHYGDDVSRETCHAQINLMQLSCELQNAYAKELSALWSVIRTLRAEALYWRQKFKDLEKLGSSVL